MRRSSDNYIRLNKKITKLPVILAIGNLTKDWGVSAQDVCHRLICESALKYESQRKEPPVPHFELPKK